MRTTLLANLMMAVGGVIWLTGELIGVFSPGKAYDTTSQWAWFLEQRYPIVRVLFFTFTISLMLHIVFRWWLLP